MSKVPTYRRNEKPNVSLNRCYAGFEEKEIRKTYLVRLNRALKRKLTRAEVIEVRGICLTAKGMLRSHSQFTSFQQVLSTLRGLITLEENERLAMYERIDETTCMYLDDAMISDLSLSFEELDMIFSDPSSCNLLPAQIKKAAAIAARKIRKSKSKGGKRSNGWEAYLAHESVRLWLRLGGPRKRAWRSYHNGDYTSRRKPYESRLMEWASVFYEVVKGKAPKGGSAWRKKLNNAVDEYKS